MLEKLQDISKIIIVPTAALYFCGFVCITSFLARFGIVTFDIVNARYLIGGIHVALPLLISLAMALYIFGFTRGARIFLLNRTPARFYSYLICLALPAMSAWALERLFSVGEYQVAGNRAGVRFGPLGDPLTQWVYSLDPHDFSEPHAIIRYWAVFFLYALGLALLLYVIWYVGSAIHRRAASGQTIGGPADANLEPRTAEKKTGHATSQFEVTIGNVDGWIVRGVDVAFVTFGFVIALYSVLKLNSAMIDIDSFTAGFQLTWSLLFCWLYLATITILLFLIISDLRPLAEPTLDIFGKWSDPFMFADALQRLVIPMIAFVFLFGSTIFPRIPFALGGGEPREVRLVSQFVDPVRDNERLFLLGESSQFFFFVQIGPKTGRAYQVSKSSVLQIETKRREMPLAR